VVHTGEEDRAQKESRVGEKRFARRRRGGGAAARQIAMASRLLSRIYARAARRIGNLLLMETWFTKLLDAYFFSFAKII
jgi:hypothetical protein